MKEIDKVISEIANARKGLQKVKAPKEEPTNKTLKISAKRMTPHKPKTMEALMPPTAVAL